MSATQKRAKSKEIRCDNIFTVYFAAIKQIIIFLIPIFVCEFYSPQNLAFRFLERQIISANSAHIYASKYSEFTLIVVTLSDTYIQKIWFYDLPWALNLYNIWIWMYSYLIFFVNSFHSYAMARDWQTNEIQRKKKSTTAKKWATITITAIIKATAKPKNKNTETI